MDRSQSQAIRSLELKSDGKKLRIEAESDEALSVEQVEVSALAKDFKKIWGITPVLIMQPVE
jgi:exopolyphosphatase/guanosine-5'-triphosphate,3'-diphosphate pyrophosphatase